MPTRQSTFFTGSSRRVLPEFIEVGDVKEIIHTHTFTQDVTTADVLEMFAIPPGTQILHWEWVSANLPASNLSAGFMSGDPGDAISNRTCDAVLNAATATPGPFTSTLAQVAAYPVRASNLGPVSIGFVPSASITAAANRTLTVRMRYAAVNP